MALRLTLALLCLTWLTVAACSSRAASGNTKPAIATADAKPPAAPVRTYTGPLAAAQLATGPALWAQIERQTWFNDGNPTAEGARLLDVLRSFGSRATPDEKQGLIEKYPDGIDEERARLGTEYERQANRTPQETFLATWLLDGLDDYEREILDLQATKVLPAGGLRRALETGAFRAAFDARPTFLTYDFLANMASLPDSVWTHAERQPWFGDGLNDTELSLLRLVSVLGTSGEQLNIIDNNFYRFVPLREGRLAVIADGLDAPKASAALDLTSRMLPVVEAFVGPYPGRELGLWLDIETTTRSAAECYAGSGEGEPAQIFLASPLCLERGAMAHEVTHTFFRNRYPTWFAEGVAELATFHITGSRSGYIGAKGTINLDSRLHLDDRTYANEAGLGAKFLVSTYQLVGADVMSRFVQQVKADDMTGQQILMTLLSVVPAERRAGVQNLIASSFTSKPPTSR